MIPALVLLESDRTKRRCTDPDSMRPFKQQNDHQSVFADGGRGREKFGL
jgi:hypothetical protein